MSECIFCNIIEKKLEADWVYEDEDIVAFRDVNPQAPFHFLVVPRRHLKTLNEVEESGLLGNMMLVAARVAREHGFADKGYRVVVNCNEDGGQTVFHVHFHVLGGRRMTWPPG